MSIRPLFRSERGSSSILVLLITITLVVFGVLSLVSAYANLKLSRKNAEWQKSYYSLDASGESLLQEIGSVLATAEGAARKYIYDTDYTREHSDLLPDELQNTVHGQWLHRGQESALFEEALFERLCRYYFHTWLQEKIAGVQLRITPEIPPEEIFTGLMMEYSPSSRGPTRVEAQLSSGKENGAQYLLIELSAECPSFKTETPADKPYRVLKWIQRQKPFEFEETLELWNGITE